MGNRLRWLDGYTGQSVDELLALEGMFRQDSIVLAIEQALQKKRSSLLSKEEASVLAIESLEREVNNGGFGQFFRNAPQCASHIVDSLRTLGCNEAAELALAAVRTLRSGDRPSVGDVAAMMAVNDAKRDEALSALDRSYSDVVGDLSGAVLAYIRLHRAFIRLE